MLSLSNALIFDGRGIPPYTGDMLIREGRSSSWVQSSCHPA